MAFRRTAVLVAFMVYSLTLVLTQLPAASAAPEPEPEPSAPAPAPRGGSGARSPAPASSPGNTSGSLGTSTMVGFAVIVSVLTSFFAGELLSGA